MRRRGCTLRRRGSQGVGPLTRQDRRWATPRHSQDDPAIEWRSLHRVRFCSSGKPFCIWPDTWVAREWTKRLMVVIAPQWVRYCSRYQQPPETRPETDAESP